MLLQVVTIGWKRTSARYTERVALLAADMLYWLLTYLRNALAVGDNRMEGHLGTLRGLACHRLFFA
jgi:hypothetical protein